MWSVVFTENAEKEKSLLKRTGLERKAKILLSILLNNPYQNPPPYEKLIGDLNGYYSRRINIQHRLIYKIDDNSHIVVIHYMWSHYE